MPFRKRGEIVVILAGLRQTPFMTISLEHRKEAARTWF
jgi:hypothetical protein